jgi:tRNA threonylcarbamoyladenosine biosynthesis protein TsaB
MRIMAVDTATTSCSVAVIHGNDVLSERNWTTDQSHSRHLMGMVAGVLADHGLSLKDLDAFAVSRGPGSFTGLRIGIGTVKALAYAADKPLVGISSLEALAAQSDDDGIVCSLLDARKGEVYSCLYRKLHRRLLPLGPERVSPVERAVAEVAGPCLFIGNGIQLHRRTLMELVESPRFAEPSCNTVRASTVARLAADRFVQGIEDDLFQFAPNYVRRSDAELNRKRHGG